MGVNLRDLFEREELDIKELTGKILAVDAFNILYQFLTTIRQPDGSPLTDSKGSITSHLVGLFSRTIHFVEKGLKFAFVFDGEVPKLKAEERERRKEQKLQAKEKYEAARKAEDIAEMKKYAGRTSRLTPEMVEESKELLEAFGIPVVQAPAEGEAQAAYMVKKGDAYAVVSQDYDAFLHGASRVVQNLSASKKKKQANKLSYAKISPEMIVLSPNLKKMNLDEDKLIALAILVGTDYNKQGIPGIGPKKGLKLVQKFGKDFDALFKEIRWDDYYSLKWEKIFETIKNMPVSDDYNLIWNPVNEEKVKKILVERHEFDEERVENSLKKIRKTSEKRKQTGLGQFISS